MKVNLTHSTVKKKDILYYVNCDVQFSEEEKAIIRARTLGEHTLDFQSGFLNLPPEASTSTPPWLMDYGPRILGLFAVIALFGTIGGVSPVFCVLFVIGAIALRIMRGQFVTAVGKMEKSELKIKEILVKPFTLCSMSSLAIPNMEREIQEKLTILKDMLSVSAEPATAKSFEL